MDDPISRTQRRKQATRASLLAAGQQQVSTTGLSSLSIQTTTQLADVALGTFYNHFANKEELVDEIFERDLRRMEAAIADLQRSADGPVQRTTAIAATCAWRAIREPGWARFAAELWSAGRWPTSSLNTWVLLPELRDGSALRHFDVRDAELAASSARDVLGGLLRRYADSEGSVEDDELLGHAVRSVLRLFGATPEAIDAAIEWSAAHPLTPSAFEEVA